MRGGNLMQNPREKKKQTPLFTYSKLPGVVPRAAAQLPAGGGEGGGPEMGRGTIGEIGKNLITRD